MIKHWIIRRGKGTPVELFENTVKQTYLFRCATERGITASRYDLDHHLQKAVKEQLKGGTVTIQTCEHRTLTEALQEIVR